MKWLIGYQLTESDLFLQEILRNREDLPEVYFSYGTMPNGRHDAAAHAQLTEWEALRRTDADLETLARGGVTFNLLLNGNCYGRDALSRQFLLRVCDMVDEIGTRFGLSSITTTSPVIADVVKRNFPALEIRASVNMEIGTIAGMEYLAQYFDGFYIARELNRDLAAIRRLREWCVRNGRKSYLLANSGCLMNCSARQFHDNLVSHEREIAQMDNGTEFHPVCTSYFRGTTDRGKYLSRLTFIRPEDVHLYEGLTDGMKLATRVNAMPAQVVRAYREERFAGNLLELLEPNHAETLYPDVRDNARLPVDFGTRTATCGHVCESGGSCRYCSDAAALSITRLPEVPLMGVPENS